MLQKRSAIVIVLVLAAIVWMPQWAAASVNTSVIPATRVIGQPDFAHSTANNGGLSANSLSSPTFASLDTQGNLFVSDSYNNRVLEYEAPLSSGMPASRVFGQPDFTHTAANNGGAPSAHGLIAPEGLALDKQGNLYVADPGNNRVLEYFASLSSGMDAGRVFGQPDFTHNVQNNGGLSATSLYDPYGIAVDIAGNLFVADLANQRVLEYHEPLSNDEAASKVFGQPDFTQNAQNNGGLSASSLLGPDGIAVDTFGDLYVADGGNSRALEYFAPFSNGMAALRVFGQPNATSNTANTGGLSAASLAHPDGVGVDAQNNVYVADTANHRVLKYAASTPGASPTGINASQVYGQPDYSSNAANNGGISSQSLRYPSDVALDAQGNLFIVDFGNNRVLGYLSASHYLWLPLVRR